MINQDAYIMRGSYIDEQGHTFKVQLPLEEMWAFHSQDKHTKMLLAAINFDGYFELPPWGYDIQRAHQVLFNYNDSYQTTSVMDLQGKMVQFKLDSQLVRKALGLHPCQKQFMGSNLRAEDKKGCFHPNSKNFTFSDIVIEDIKLAAELMMQHFHFAIPNRFTKPRIQFVRILTDAHRKMSEKMDFAPWILRELLASRTYNPARGRYLAAVPALTRIAYLGIGAISQLPEPLRLIKGIPKSVRAVRGIAQKCRQSFGDSSDEEQTGDFNEHDASAYDEEQGKEDRSLAQRMKKISNLIQETNMCPEDDANRSPRHKLAEEQEDPGFQERSPPVENQRQMCKEIDTNKTDLFLKELLPSDECTPIWDNKMKEPASMQVTIPKDTVIESRISVNGQYEESEKECGNDVGYYEEQSNALLVLIEADKERATDVIETRLLQTGSVTQDRSEKNVHKRKLAEAELEEPFCVGKAIKGDVVNVEHARKDRESGSNINELPAPQAKAISSQQSPISIGKEEMKKKIEELKATAIQFACVQTIEEQKKEFPENGQLNEKHRNSAVIQIAMQAMDAIEDLDVHDQVTCFSDEYMTSMYNNLYIQLMKTQTVQKMREAALMKHLDLLSELLYDSVEQMDVKNRRIHDLEAELVKLRNHQLDLQVKATQMEVHLLQSLNLERVMSIKEHLVEEKNNEIRRLSDRLQECELQLIQAEKVARDAIEDAKIAQSKLQEERQLHLQTMRPQVLGQDADPIASFNGKELQRLQYQLQRAEKLREQQEKDMSELYLQNTQLQTTLADLQNEIQSLKFNVVVLSPGKNQASSANKNCKCYFPTSCSIIENRGKAPIAAMSFLSHSIRPTSRLELEGNKPALTCTVSEQLCVDGEASRQARVSPTVPCAESMHDESLCSQYYRSMGESTSKCGSRRI
ncbi:hypothetical protein KP509_06G021700 [Ceratopteris richardii]|uniref:Uncharacterized protein n=1 Tax=Ceratopteris richardii TaxID=49495 RepID=A0A8T2UJ14_CERRI|nr:hypothetical protein KP509_06G021700 [Ceratopteris richardii]